MPPYPNAWGESIGIETPSWIESTGYTTIKVDTNGEDMMLVTYLSMAIDDSTSDEESLCSP